MENYVSLKGQKVTVYDRYLFAVPVRGYVKSISEKDGAFEVIFYGDNPGGENVTKHSGKFFHHQQCRLDIYKDHEHTPILKQGKEITLGCQRLEQLRECLEILNSVETIEYHNKNWLASFASPGNISREKRALIERAIRIVGSTAAQTHT